MNELAILPPLGDITVAGQPITELPMDLYIPPDHLRVLLETFEGPLDLLLYLIKKQRIDILDIPVAEITKQYMQFVNLMQVMNIELAAEYLLMAALLAEIKSRLLLPLPPSTEEEEMIDPRADLVRRLQEYERYKQAAYALDEHIRVERDIYIAAAALPPLPIKRQVLPIDLSQLMDALQQVFQRAQLREQYAVMRESLSIRERMTLVLSAARGGDPISFYRLFTIEEGRMGVVVTLIAILELIRQSLLELIQAQPGMPIYIRIKT